MSKRRFIFAKQRFVRTDRRFDLRVSPLHFCEAGLPTAKDAKTQQKSKKSLLQQKLYRTKFATFAGCKKKRL